MRKVVAILMLALLITGCATVPATPKYIYSPTHVYPSPAETVTFIMLVKFIYGQIAIDEWAKITNRATCSRAIAKAKAFNAAQTIVGKYSRIHVGCLWNPRDKKV